MRYISLTCDPDRRLRRMPLGDLVRFQGAFKSLHEDQYAKLKRSMEDKGFFAPIFVWQNQILDGHQRLNVLERENWDIDGGVPVVEIEAENEKDAAEKLLLLSSTYGKVDAQGLYEFTAEKGVDLREFDLPDLPDFDVGEYLDEYHAEPESEGDPDEVPAPPVVPVTQAGDLWLLGDHRVLCGDSTSAEDVARVMDGALAQMAFTDPPYGVDYTGGAKKRESLANDNIGTDIYSASLCHLTTAADDKAPLYLWYADGHVAAAAAAAAGYKITAQIIWAKNHAQFVTSAHYKGKHEPCFYAHRKGKGARWYGPNNEVTLWECDRSPRNDWHPTQKPVELAVRAIGNSTDKGEVVLDLFLGGGTTLIAAEDLGRVCYGLEIAPQYVDVIVNRWQNHTGGAATLDGDGRTFAEVAEARGHDLPKTDEKGYGAAAG